MDHIHDHHLLDFDITTKNSFDVLLYVIIASIIRCVFLRAAKKQPHLTQTHLSCLSSGIGFYYLYQRVLAEMFDLPSLSNPLKSQPAKESAE